MDGLEKTSATFDPDGAGDPHRPIPAAAAEITKEHVEKL
jgi:hypothetical protein